MGHPTFTVIIPTRERPQTLRYAMQSVLCQIGSDLELVVADNLSGSETAEVVRSFNDPRVVYARTDRRLSMCDNWDFAFTHAHGDYIAFLGDDDAMMPRALHKMRQIAQYNKSPQTVMGTSYHYVWPDGDLPAELMWVPTRHEPYRFELEDLIPGVFRRGGAGYDRLPSAYRCFVHRTVYERIAQKTGRIFHSMAPDVFTAFALPIFSPVAYHVGEPLFVSGQSRRRGDQMQSWVAAWEKEFTGYRLHKFLTHDLLPPSFHGFNVVADSALVASDLFPGMYGRRPFNLAAYYGWFLSSSRAVPVSHLPRFLSKVREASDVNRSAVLAWWALYRGYHAYSYARLHRKAADPRFANLATDVASFAQQADALKV